MKPNTVNRIPFNLYALVNVKALLSSPTTPTVRAGPDRSESYGLGGLRVWRVGLIGMASLLNAS